MVVDAVAVVVVVVKTVHVANVDSVAPNSKFVFLVVRCQKSPQTNEKQKKINKEHLKKVAQLFNDNKKWRTSGVENAICHALFLIC